VLKVGLYARVSTHDQQTLPMQLAAMREYAKRRGWKIAIEEREVGSGAKTRPKREELLRPLGGEKSMPLSCGGLIDGGDLYSNLIATLQELHAVGVGFVSLTEALDMTTPGGEPWPACSPCSRNSSATSCEIA